MISLKQDLADYSYSEFRSIVDALIQATGSREWQERLLEHFIELVAHPDGSDLIYYTGDKPEDCTGQVMTRIVAWRASKGLSVFRD
ncbi:TPA: bacteriocin immunity protein [Pseudomonas putida]|uniref:Colicin immunity protein/pyocin immunity protein n=1 Tax=Pseudomonas putida (strain GB-1) TaxID=76869 RepID=B0KGN5_PSEPG|nr:bacteriocin immunity protein [Pseudomonas putida]MCE0999667.1 bacteriocin immunity protein [Pseudomonas sp. NMI1173_11]MCK2187904.1 bacteriocin immunity protein [Pseudomonas sp. MB04B]ABZ00431.1 Colicin immunity protein/pyocin immunity protein [Pseudomonas putida GB-1]MDD2086130.1 bacteriocin immunity protein [Pseudomonas putida]MDD2096103.1 bacteriocin immunity protein [Pseudomonas putida]